MTGIAKKKKQPTLNMAVQQQVGGEEEEDAPLHLYCPGSRILPVGWIYSGDRNFVISD